MGKYKRKIICYGIKNRELRRKVNLYLSDDYEIIGYSDSFLSEDILQGEYFIKPEEIPKVSFDKILILVQSDLVQEEIRKKLINMGIDSSKIMIPRLLFNNEALYVPNLKNEILKKFNKDIKGIICGLSYSLIGINVDMLRENTIDFSWHGLDLYYNYLQVKFFVELYENKLDYALLVFPYYYFNYDMSVSLYQFESAQIMACHGFGDWHNSINSSEEKIKDYLNCFELFGDKFWKSIFWKKYCPKNRNIIEGGKAQLSNIWKRKHNVTQEENIKIFKKILQILKENVKYIYIIVPPICISSIETNDIKYIKSCKDDFYDILQSVNVYDFQIIDYSEIFNFNFFYDHEHLNETGRKKFTELINKILECRKK